jgi:hypothetical protein
MQHIPSSSVTTIMAQAKHSCTHLALISRYLHGRNIWLPSVTLSAVVGRGWAGWPGTGAASVLQLHFLLLWPGSGPHDSSPQLLRVPVLGIAQSGNQGGKVFFLLFIALWQSHSGVSQIWQSGASSGKGDWIPSIQQSYLRGPIWEFSPDWDVCSLFCVSAPRSSSGVEKIHILLMET